MEVVLRDLSSLSAQFTSNSWEFNPKYIQECKALLKQSRFLCANDTWICRLSSASAQADSSVWWKIGICNGFAILLVRIFSLLQDCRQEPTYKYSARDFWSLWLELSWYNELVVSCNSEIDRLDTICLQDDFNSVLQTHESDDFNSVLQTRDSDDCRGRHWCEIAGNGMFAFNEVIREGNHEGIGSVRKVDLIGLEGRAFASKCISSNGLHEIDILLEVNHPNVVRVKGWCEKGMMTPCLVLELMDKDLRKWVSDEHPLHGMEGSRFQKESNLHWDYMVVAIDILHQIAQGMRYVQKCNVVHRDLKTDNILVKEELYEGRTVSYFVTAKIADFGTSKKNDDGQFTTGKVGTRTYRAPEVMKAEEWGKYSPRVDLWSFGVLAWEVLTGQVPMNVDGKPLIWPKRRGWIHPYLVGCIQSCWEMKPGKRPTFESICIVLQHLKKSMFRNKGLYHASSTILAGKSPNELAEQYQMYQRDLNRWWMIVLVNDLRPSKRLFHFNPQGCDPRKVNRVLDSIFRGSLSQHSFLRVQQNLLHRTIHFNRSLSSSPDDSFGSSFHAVNETTFAWDDTDLVAPELCSLAALNDAVSVVCTFVEDTVEVCPKDLSNSIRILFRQLATRLHQQHYS